MQPVAKLRGAPIPIVTCLIAMCFAACGGPRAQPPPIRARADDASQTENASASSAQHHQQAEATPWTCEVLLRPDELAPPIHEVLGNTVHLDATVGLTVEAVSDEFYGGRVFYRDDFMPRGSDHVVRTRSTAQFVDVSGTPADFTDRMSVLGEVRRDPDILVWTVRWEVRGMVLQLEVGGREGRHLRLFCADSEPVTVAHYQQLLPSWVGPLSELADSVEAGVRSSTSLEGQRTVTAYLRTEVGALTQRLTSAGLTRQPRSDSFGALGVMDLDGANSFVSGELEVLFVPGSEGLIKVVALRR